MRVCAIDYDPKKFFGTCLYNMERQSKKYFMSGPRRGMVDPSPVPILDPAKTRFGGDTGQITQRFRLVIMAILEVFGMDRSRGESVWVELERYGALVNTNHGNFSARWIRDQLTNSGNHNLLGLPPEAPTMPRGLVLVF